MKHKTAVIFIIAALTIFPVNVLAQSRLESSNFAIVDANFDSTGGTSESANYAIVGSINPLADARMTSGSYALGSGFPNGIQANVPLVRCFETSTDDVGGGAPNTACTDPALTASTGGSDLIVGNGMYGVCGTPGCYNRAKVEIDRQNNPIDTLYLVALSPDNFANPALTVYLQSDTSVTSTLTYSNYLSICQLQGYDANDTACDDNTDGNWNASKQQFNITGLGSGKTWYVKVRALSGDFTETQYSPATSATLVYPALTIDLDVSTTNTETAAPYSIALGTLTNTVTTAAQFIWVDLNTNSYNGAGVFVADQNNGLFSGANTIPSETEDLSVSDGDGGYGIQATSATQTSLGPLQINTAFSLSANNVRGLSTTAQQLFFTDTLSSNRGPLAGGRGQVTIKARGDNLIAADDYADQISFTAVATW
jgi:hypothetical protein